MRRRYDGNPWSWVTAWRLKLVGFSRRRWNLASVDSYHQRQKRDTLRSPFLLSSALLMVPEAWEIQVIEQSWEKQGQTWHKRHREQARLVVSEAGMDLFWAASAIVLVGHCSHPVGQWRSHAVVMSELVWGLNQWQLPHWPTNASCWSNHITWKVILFQSLFLAKLWHCHFSLAIITGNTFGLQSNKKWFP